MTPALTINSPPSPSPTPLPKTTPYLNGVSNTIPNGIYNHNHPIEEEEQLILHRTPWIPPTAISGNGIYVGLKDGRNVIDAVGGAAVGCLGNGHPEVIKAIKEQAEKLAYVYNMQLTNEPAEKLAKFLVDTSDGAFASVGFLSGGSEAMEACIKLARQYYFETGQPQREHFIARKLSFHGNTLSTLSLGHHPGRRGPYAPILQTTNFHHVSPAYYKRFGEDGESEEMYVERLRKELEGMFEEVGGDKVCAFVAETVVGATTGVVIPPKGYFKAMKEVCQKYGALFILDEIMCGMGRMGSLHTWKTLGDGAVPDMQAVAKGLGGGYASIGAVLMSREVAEGIKSGSGYWQHGHTYQAHPISCAASLSVQNIIQSQSLLANVQEKGKLLGSLLRATLLSPQHPASKYTFDIRGAGLFWGVEFDVPLPLLSSPAQKKKRFGAVVQEECFKVDLVVMGFSGGANLDGVKGDHVVLAPAYNVTHEEVEEIVRRFERAVGRAVGVYFGESGV